MHKETAMTPTQIANNLALVALADMQNPEQAVAATDLLMKTIPHLRNALLGDLEIAADTSKDSMLSYLSSLIRESLFVHTAMDDDDSDVTDEEIINDGVSDGDDEEAEDELDLSSESIGNELLDKVAQMKEVAMGQIRDKGKFLPLDDIELPEESKASVKINSDKSITLNVPGKAKVELKAKRVNIMGKVAAAD